MVAATLLACATDPAREGPRATPAANVDAPARGDDTPRAPPSPSDVPGSGGARVEDTGREIPPLDAPDGLIALDVPGFLPAVVVAPRGATSRRPILIATHGNYDRPEWQCATWAPRIARRGFVLCPRGVARGDSPSRDDVRWEYRTNQALEREVLAALAALKARFPAHVDDGPVVYTGFSLGAIMGVPIALRAPAQFRRLVLTEGGAERWSLASAKAFRAGGGERILFACGQASCTASAKTAAATIAKAELGTKVVSALGNGHSYGGPVADEIARAFAWLVEGDARWDD